MKEIISYIRSYFIETNKVILLCTTLFTGILIFLNYYYSIDSNISRHESFAYHFIARYVIFLPAFAIPYLLYQFISEKKYLQQNRFIILLLLAPAIFSLKIAIDIPFHITDDFDRNRFWEQTFYWPMLVIITGTILFIIWKIFDRVQPFYGIRTKGINWKPYLLMLLIMLPLVAAASTQPDFLEMYPKLKLITGQNDHGITWYHKLLFELSYGSDFITIELFFRGFLILAFIKWAGKDAILPMACFYCSIHFGKPLGECISSYFGGMILGIVVYNTRSIFGGLIVHLGIAWMMEVGGYIGNA
ncbi:MAG: abortive infection protein [Sphingobacteriales bacterium]|nr:abortive infection protein [Sphingobacteriales bacterium]